MTKVEGLKDEPAREAAFADGKDAGALRTIGEVAKALGIRQHVLRYWEDQFPMLKPLKRSGGRRYYRPADVVLVESIDRLVHQQGYTLKGALKALQDQGDAAASPVPAPGNGADPALTAPAPSFAFRARLIALRTTLVNALHES